MRTQIDWIEGIAIKQIDDNAAASNGRGLLWMYCNMQTIAILVLCMQHCAFVEPDSTHDCGHAEQQDQEGTDDAGN